MIARAGHANALPTMPMSEGLLFEFLAFILQHERDGNE